MAKKRFGALSDRASMIHIFNGFIYKHCIEILPRHKLFFITNISITNADYMIRRRNMPKK